MLSLSTSSSGMVRAAASFSHITASQPAQISSSSSNWGGGGGEGASGAVCVEGGGIIIVLVTYFHNKLSLGVLVFGDARKT